VSCRHSQKSRIIGYLATGKRASKMLLIRRGFGSKPDTRISELRADGHDIRDEWVTTKTSRFKVYWLARRKGR